MRHQVLVIDLTPSPAVSTPARAAYKLHCRPMPGHTPPGHTTPFLSATGRNKVQVDNRSAAIRLFAPVAFVLKSPTPYTRRWNYACGLYLDWYFLRIGKEASRHEGSILVRRSGVGPLFQIGA